MILMQIIDSMRKGERDLKKKWESQQTNYPHERSRMDKTGICKAEQKD